MQNFTVAICTHNRASLLRNCLKGLEATLCGIDADIVVVDNASTDATAEAVKTSGSRARYVMETKIGLSNARNRAISECNSLYIVFLDDDAIPEETWGAAVAAITERGEADVFGGPFIPYYTSEKPDWFDDSFGSGHLDLVDGQQAPGVCFTGCNMGLRLALLKEAGGFNPFLGMEGDTLRLGEETALQIELQRSKPWLRFEFSSLMKIKHHISKDRMTLSYISRRNFNYGFLLQEIDQKSDCHKLGPVGFIRQSKLGFPLLLRLAFRDRQRYPRWHTYAAMYLTLNSIFLGVQVRHFQEIWRRSKPLHLESR